MARVATKKQAIVRKMLRLPSSGVRSFDCWVDLPGMGRLETKNSNRLCTKQKANPKQVESGRTAYPCPAKNTCSILMEDGYVASRQPTPTKIQARVLIAKFPSNTTKEKMPASTRVNTNVSRNLELLIDYRFCRRNVSNA